MPRPPTFSDLLLDVGGRGIEERTGLEEAGVVHEDVDRANLGSDPDRSPAHRVVVRDVAWKRMDAIAGGLSESLGLPPENCDLPAISPQPACHLQAEPGTATRNDSYLRILCHRDLPVSRRPAFPGRRPRPSSRLRLFHPWWCRRERARS